MKIVKLKGGLGNQMFQYAFATLLKEKTGEDVYLDYSSFTNLKNDIIRVPRINSFNLTIPQAEQNQISNVCKIKHNSNSQSFIYRLGLFLEALINKKYFRERNRAYINIDSILDYCYYDGYWQSWRYIQEVQDILAINFKPNYKMAEKTLNTIEQMNKLNSVFIGVRKGDYISEAKHYGSFSINYYSNAMRYISNKVDNPIFYVFSNDISWCKNNLNFNGYNIEYREPEMQVNDFEEIMLMASCKHAIIVNSTFNWWGAYLIENKDKIVCCPEKWFFDNKPIDIIPPEWHKIKD